MPIAERFRTAPEDAPTEASRKLPPGKVPWKFFTPLIWAPAFPFIRMACNRRPQARPFVITAAILVANMHGFWLINNPDLSDEALDVEIVRTALPSRGGR